MQRYTGYFFVPLLVWMPPMARAQAPAYEPQSSTPLSSAFIYLLVIGIVGFIVFFIYRFYSTRDKETPQTPRITPKAQPAQRPINVPNAGPYVSGRSLYRTGVTIALTLLEEFTTGSSSIFPGKSFSKT
jgi:hypothetical protein